MDCPECKRELQPARLSLRAKGHGLYEQCRQAFLELDGEVVLHDRRGGFFFKKKKAEAEMEAWRCLECGIIVLRHDAEQSSGN
jgi:hypothetical protein